MQKVLSTVSTVPLDTPVGHNMNSEHSIACCRISNVLKTFLMILRSIKIPAYFPPDRGCHSLHGVYAR